LPSGSNYTDFSFDIRPTVDFLSQLMSHGDGIEVLEPEDVRQKMKEMIENARNRY
jgi:predicted DNA-binding transcriptional regulator YafY